MMGNVKMLFTSEQINELTSMITIVIVEWDRYAGSIFLFKTFLGMDRCQSVKDIKALKSRVSGSVDIYI